MTKVRVETIHSPSRVLADEVGQWIPKGIAVGIEGNVDAVEKAAKKMAIAAIPDIPSAMIPNAALNGVNGNTVNNTTNFSPSVVINSNDPFQVALEQERALRRLAFQGGITR
jgi:hypothetical protein